MPPWIPAPDWKDQDAIIIGGGPSLSSFDFSSLRGRNVIGVNDAFKLGREVVRWCIFGDASWYKLNEKLLPESGIPTVTVAPALAELNLPWLHYMRRERMGLFKDSRCAWNFSTGAAAVNFALYLGANRIFLLGFDMQNGKDGRPHWHSYNDCKVLEFSYRRFLTGFRAIDAEIRKVFPGTGIINVTDGTSKLPFFPRINFETFKKYIPPQNRVECVPCAKRKIEALERAAA